LWASPLSDLEEPVGVPGPLCPQCDRHHRGLELSSGTDMYPMLGLKALRLVPLSLEGWPEEVGRLYHIMSSLLAGQG
jgi:hypothetical protein